MQRQSLGSPPIKLHGLGGRVTSAESAAASPSPSETPVIVSAAGAVDDDDAKLEKVHRRRSSSSPPPFLPAEAEKYIHFVPIITLLCFLVLFLCSHEPTPTDLAHFNGFNHPLKLADSIRIDDFERVLDKDEILAIRSLRNLQEIRKEGNKKSNSNRKLADF